MIQLNQSTQPLTETNKEALLLIAAGDIEGLRTIKLSSAIPLLSRGYIERNKTAQGTRLILTQAGRELIPSLALHQAM